jgi:hypothetical protein
LMEFCGIRFVLVTYACAGWNCAQVQVSDLANPF